MASSGGSAQRCAAPQSAFHQNKPLLRSQEDPISWSCVIVKVTSDVDASLWFELRCALRLHSVGTVKNIEHFGTAATGPGRGESAHTPSRHRIVALRSAHACVDTNRYADLQ